MTKVKIGEIVSDIKTVSTSGEMIRLSDFRGKKIVLYFYPRDNTPGCTLEGRGFRDNKEKFSALNALIMGVSRDNIKSHEGFKNKQSFNFELLSDTDEELCKQFDVIKDKNMYGKKVRGIERSTFLIDESGVLIHEWRRVKVSGHVDAVLARIKAVMDNEKNNG